MPKPLDIQAEYDNPDNETCSFCTVLWRDADLRETDIGRICPDCFEAHGIDENGKPTRDYRDEGIDRGAELSYWCNSSSVTGIFQGM